MTAILGAILGPLIKLLGFVGAFFVAHKSGSDAAELRRARQQKAADEKALRDKREVEDEIAGRSEAELDALRRRKMRP